MRWEAQSSTGRSPLVCSYTRKDILLKLLCGDSEVHARENEVKPCWVTSRTYLQWFGVLVHGDDEDHNLRLYAQVPKHITLWH